MISLDDSITAKGISDALGITKQAVMKQAEKEGWPYINGENRAKQFIVDRLPEDVRMALAPSSSQPVAITQPQAVPSLYKGTHCPAELSEQENRIALARVDLIRAYLEEKDLAKSKKESIVQAGKTLLQGYNTGHLFSHLFEILGRTSYPTVESWVKKWREADYDYTALATRYGNRKGQRKVTDEEFNTALSFALHPNRLRMTEITRLTKMSLKRRGIPSPSHQATISRALADWRERHYDKWVFCREGEKALNDKVLPYLERDVSLLEVGDVLVADGHVLNFQILHPFTGKPCRMMMVMWYDWASCFPAGWEIMPTENTQCVAAGLRRAILTLGKRPKVVYLDNGKAFKAKIFTDKDIDFEEAGFYGMFARLGIETVFAWPYNAQSKPVERWFSTFNELERLIPTYTGASIADKPAHMLRNEKLHKKIHEKKYGGWVPTVEEANQIIAGWVMEYARRSHQGLKGLRPKDVLEAGRGPGVDEKELRHLMMSMEIKNVGRNGVRFLGRDYYDPALYGQKERVLIKYDLEDLTEIYIYDRTGKKELCTAKPVQPVHPMARILGQKEDLELVKTGIKQKRALKRSTENFSRAYVEDAPDLIVLPDRTGGQTTKEQPLPRAKAEQIEAEAAKMKVLEFTPNSEPYESDADHYEDCLERECSGQVLPLSEMEFMRAFEKTQAYRDLKERFAFLRELYLAGPETEEAL